MKTSEERKLALLKRFHAVCRQLGMDEETRKEMVRGCGHTSSKDLNVTELESLLAKLKVNVGGVNLEISPEQESKDRWRKRVLAAGCSWRRSLGHPQDGKDIAYVKATVCRMTGVTQFNLVTLSKLRDCYNSFLVKKRALDTAESIERTKTVRLNTIESHLKTQ